MAAPEDICTELVSFLKEQGEASGSTLGTLLRERFPTFNVRLRYGSLRQFILQSCTERIGVSGQRGGDDIYALTQEAKGEPISAAVVADDAWQAFSNPTFPFRLAVYPASGDVLTLAPGTAPPDGFVEVAKISEDDQRRMAVEFLPTLADDLRPSFEAALEAEDYWPEWRNLVSRYSMRGVFSRWIKWHDESISATLIERLKQVGVEPSAVSQAVAAVFRAKRRKTGVPPPERNAAAAGVTGEIESRAVAHAAIDQMTEGQLRHLWLPLGSVIDGLRGPKR